MSLKGVEMQIAVPRTSEATSIQNHLNQKPTHDQVAIAQQNMKQQDQQRHKSAEVDASAFLHVREDGKGNGRSRSGAKTRKGKAAEDARLPTADLGHPFKGKHIDISL
jgi:3D (Asp-Asp-Asp) domain-containing protein